MATYSQLGLIAADPGFQARVRVAMFTAALGVYNEAMTTPAHGARALLAAKVLHDNFDLPSVACAVITNPTIEANANPTQTPDFNIADSDIQFQVSAIWNAFASA